LTLREKGVSGAKRNALEGSLFRVTVTPVRGTRCVIDRGRFRRQTDRRAAAKA
jgi:hypothetical protein